MKNKLFYLSILSFVLLTASCSNNKNDVSAKPSEFVLGDSLLKIENIAEQINKTCFSQYDFFQLPYDEHEAHQKACLWCRVTFDYWKLSKNKKVRELLKNNENRLYVKNFPSPIPDRHPQYYSYLFIENMGMKEDSILIYKNDNFGLAMFLTSKFFFIENESLITIEIRDDEYGTWVEKYNKYKIDLKRGKFIQIWKKKFKRKIPLPKRKQEIPIDPKYHGTFSTYTETEQTTTGMASIEYTFSITFKGIELTTNTYHEPIQCNGTYIALEKDPILELYYNGREANCDTETPLFFLKEENGDIYAKGLGGEGTYNDWIKLKRE